MNSKRLLLAIVAVFVTVWVTNFLIHSVWLMNDYKETMNLWRPEADMRNHIVWLFLGQIVYAVIFVVVWVNGLPVTGCLRGACLYGACMGLFSESNTLITYAVQPLPASIAVKWFASGIVQGAVLGMVAVLVYRPKTSSAASGGA